MRRALLIGVLTSATALAGAVKTKPRPLSESSYDDIIANYLIIADFIRKDVKEEYETPVLTATGEVFWRYDFPVPRAEFPLEPLLSGTEAAGTRGELKDWLRRELPQTTGSGEYYYHLNRGRLLFMEGKYSEARDVWLMGRAKVGNKSPHSRRLDYFIAYAGLAMANEERMKSSPPLSWNDPSIQGLLANVTPFLSSAYILKKDVLDDIVEMNSGKGFYNLAAMYYAFTKSPAAILGAADPKTAGKPGSWPAVFGAGREGLDWFRTADRDKYGDQFRYRPRIARLMAESLIENGSYLEAVQAFDTSLRQDRDPVEAARSFARMGDMYYELGNVRIAEEMYGLSAKIDADLGHVDAAQIARWAECLFWLGDFSKSQKVFDSALRALRLRPAGVSVDREYLARLSLRIADGYLARAGARSRAKKNIPTSEEKSYASLFDSAKLAYYRVSHEFDGSQAAALAKVRRACLELPGFETDASRKYKGSMTGGNVALARQLLQEARSIPVPESKEGVENPARIIKEMAWACEVGSYARRERTPDMVDRVRKFAKEFPESAFLTQFAEPVRLAQSDTIDKYLAAGDGPGAIAFFEANRERLYSVKGQRGQESRVPEALATKLFGYYMDAYDPAKASEFFDTWKKSMKGARARVDEAVFLAEMVGVDSGKMAKTWSDRNQRLALDLRVGDERLKRDDDTVLAFQRLLSAKGVAPHFSWMLREARQWGEKDAEIDCSLVYPILSRVGREDESSRGVTADEYRLVVMSLVDRRMPEVAEKDPVCSRSLLEIEFRALSEDPSRLAARYMTRDKWPLSADLLGLTWAVAEAANKAKRLDDARVLWKRIADKGPGDAPETRFAKARLDPRRTEYERLWQ